ncbi:MAG: tRNA 2-thiouridine(34) synthase MnmA [Bacteroidetes bacterium]|nr:tRNA 2-thiouridine(34) synthase MnmA [Bacteroidota bacterium]MCL1968331.1 tRNA 2-thiouridine(34) synthase MnmA [Bacteroidota bacterium]
MNKRVLLGMSGGIDSSVSAMLLKEDGFDITGMTFRSYDSISKACMEKETGCCSVDSIFEAKNLADDFGFPHYILDTRKLFEDTIIADFIAQYMSGFTPNPCVLCNKIIKWGKMIEECDKHHCDFLATGHYAQVAFENNRYFLRKAVDKSKDQTYFLWTLTQENLKRTIFPLGHLTKLQVREIARRHNYLKLSQKRESQEICFVIDDDYRSFLREKVADIDQQIGEGNYVDISGKILGKHKGYPFYTIGQRKGLGIALGYPAYVVNINAHTNTVTLGTKDDLLTQEMWIGNVNLMKYEKLNKNMDLTCKIRFNNEGEKCKVQQVGDRMKIEFEKPVSAITPGQSAVIYEDDDLVCGGIILKEGCL